MKKLLSIIILFFISINSFSQDFQGKAYYQSKTSFQFGEWGNRMSAEQKNAMKERMRSYLEKTFILKIEFDSKLKGDVKTDVGSITPIPISLLSPAVN